MAGNAIANVDVEAVDAVGNRGEARSGSDGSFAIDVSESDGYQLQFWTGRSTNACWVRYVDGGPATTSWDDASLIRVAGDDVSGVVFRVPDNPCG